MSDYFQGLVPGDELFFDQRKDKAHSISEHFGRCRWFHCVYGFTSGYQ